MMITLDLRSKSIVVEPFKVDLGVTEVACPIGDDFSKLKNADQDFKLNYIALNAIIE